jgi:hypothetical protein
MNESWQAIAAAAAISLAAIFPASAAGQQLVDHSVFGIVIGEKLKLPACPTDPMAKHALCEMRRAPDRRVRYKDLDATLETVAMPGDGIDTSAPGWVNGKLSVWLIDDIVESVNFGTYGARAQDVALTALKDKWGEPTIFTNTPVQNGLGVRFVRYNAEWDFAGLKVVFQGMADKIDWGIVWISTPKYDAHRNAANEQREKSTSKL